MLVTNLETYKISTMNTSLNNDNIKVPIMRDISEAINKFVAMGYTQNFKATENGLMSLETSKEYSPEELTIENFFRFEGISDPDDNSILYVLQAEDGAKGTIIDAYGMYADPLVGKIMKKIEHAEKK
jgi:hypothetical protein